MARTLRDQMREVPGAVDVTVKQVLDYPTLFLDVDRERAAEMGISQRDAANSMLVSLSSSVLVAPSYFVNPANQVNYPVAVEVPLPRMTSAQDVLATPVTAGCKARPAVVALERPTRILAHPFRRWTTLPACDSRPNRPRSTTIRWPACWT